ncbi:putative Glycosyl transferase, family 39 [Nitrospira japonica]|uniref:Putative Glycosyl transferase, family 39 n=1 Tax=Nitrospira japonica TaxID=1325564 RepID=A0A1W1I1K4_9BACT|nr:glycosyltransferase family 39 protein [Nitrospira japonica]SLM46888.1 putative Glycosyl transferase, family 39 [Nitrospira japonica]
MAKHLVNLALLLALAGILLFVGLGSIGLTDRDEGRNAEAGREMLETGDWITPTFNYEPRFYKPALVYWLMSGSYSLFGVNEFAARFHSALFGIALILVQYWFSVCWQAPNIGLFSALMLLLNIEMIGLNRMALTDSVLVFFTTTAQFAFWAGLHGTGRRSWMWWFYAAMGIATLAKGPVGFIIPLVTMTLYLTFTRRWGQFWREGHPLLGTGLFVLVTLPWYGTMLAIHGSAYVTIAKAQTVGRFMAPMEGHGFGLLFYVPVVLLGFFPWSALLPMSMYGCLKAWKAARRTGASAPPPATAGAGTASTELELFASLWVIGSFVFFTLSSTKLQHYIAPLFPAAALLTATYWHRSLVDPATKGVRAAIHVMMGLGFLLALGLSSIPWIYSRFSDKLLKEFPSAGLLDPSAWDAGPYAAALVLLIGMAMVGYWGLNEQRRAGAFWAAGGTLALVVLITIRLSLPLMNHYFVSPPQELAYAAGVNLQPSDHFVVYGSTRPSTIFYARRQAVFIPFGEEETIRLTLAKPDRTMVLLPERFRSNLPKEADQLVPLLRRHGYVLLANQPMVTIPEGTAPPPARLSPH